MKSQLAVQSKMLETIVKQLNAPDGNAEVPEELQLPLTSAADVATAETQLEKESVTSSLVLCSLLCAVHISTDMCVITV